MKSALLSDPALTTPPTTATITTLIEQGITQLLNDCPGYLYRELTCSHLRQRLVEFMHDRLSQSPLKTVSKKELQAIAQSGLHYLLQEETLHRMKQ
jgi:hypothetical protein